MREVSFQIYFHIQSSLVLYGDGWSCVLHWSKHHYGSQGAHRTNWVSNLSLIDPGENGASGQGSLVFENFGKS